MSRKQIQEWLTYWHNAKMVAVESICAFDQVHLARKYCECMRVGVFENVTDLAIWNALVELRSNVARAGVKEMTP
jgi:hypothetical protein